MWQLNCIWFLKLYKLIVYEVFIAEKNCLTLIWFKKREKEKNWISAFMLIKFTIFVVLFSEKTQKSNCKIGKKSINPISKVSKNLKIMERRNWAFGIYELISLGRGYFKLVILDEIGLKDFSRPSAIQKHCEYVNIRKIGP